MLGGHRKETVDGRQLPVNRRLVDTIWPTMRSGRTLPHMQHVARVLASPLTGVYSTHIDSAQQFTRHWHDSVSTSGGLQWP